MAILGFQFYVVPSQWSLLVSKSMTHDETIAFFRVVDDLSRIFFEAS